MFPMERRIFVRKIASKALRNLELKNSSVLSSRLDGTNLRARHERGNLIKKLLATDGTLIPPMRDQHLFLGLTFLLDAETSSA